MLDSLIRPGRSTHDTNLKSHPVTLGVKVGQRRSESTSQFKRVADAGVIIKKSWQFLMRRKRSEFKNSGWIKR